MGRYVATSISGTLLLLTGILMLLIPRLLFPTCQFAGMMEMERAARMICNTTGRITQLLGLITIAGGGAAIFKASLNVRRWGLIAAIISSLLLFPIYLLWPGVCHSTTMPCRVGTLPAIMVLGIVQTSIALIGMAATGIKGKH
jgi:hypothetical protein